MFHWLRRRRIRKLARQLYDAKHDFLESFPPKAGGVLWFTGSSIVYLKFARWVAARTSQVLTKKAGGGYVPGLPGVKIEG